MTENLPVPTKPKMRPLHPDAVDIDTMFALILSVGLVALLAKPLANVEMMGWWWGSFIIFNIAYMIYGMEKGWIKGDIANAMVIGTGPIAFYFWTILGAWKKYYRNTG